MAGMRVCMPAIVFLLLCGGVAAADAKTLNAGLKAIRHAEPAERIRGVGLLASCTREPERSKAARALQRALFDGSAPIRHGAVGALVRLNARAAAGDIVRLLEVERDVRVLPVALLALGTLRAAGAAATLKRHAAHPDAAVRAASVAAAGDIGGRGMRRLVLNSLRMAGGEDGTWLVRSAALVALSKIGRAEDLAVVQHAYDAGGGRAFWLARASLARVVARLHPNPQGPLEGLLVDVDARVAVTAAKGLADAGLVSVLLAHLGNTQASVRAAALGGVRQAKLRQAAPRLKHMARRDRSRGVRWAATKVLFAWDDPYADALMVDAVRSKEPAIWAEAIALLARRTGATHARDAVAWSKALKARRAR